MSAPPYEIFAPRSVSLDQQSLDLVGPDRALDGLAIGRERDRAVALFQQIRLDDATGDEGQAQLEGATPIGALIGAQDQPVAILRALRRLYDDVRCAGFRQRAGGWRGTLAVAG